MADAIASLLGQQPDARALALKVEHPEYTTHKASWQILLDAFEGDGGFLDGSYLWPYPRETGASFTERQAMARYHNYVESLVDLYVRTLSTDTVKRESGNEDYNKWLANVDGAGTTISDFMKAYASMALVHGHSGALVDKTPDEADGPTKADEKATVIANVFPATSIQDWRFERDVLSAVKLRETAPDPPITEELTEACQYLLWTKGGWARFKENGELVSAAEVDLGLVPLVLLRPKPSQTSQVRGRALVSNANIPRALFNRASEEDNVLRDQAFSQLTVEVPPDGSVANAKEDLGAEVGTKVAIVVRGKVDFKTPDQTVPGTIRQNIGYLIQELYRAAHVRYQRDSLDAESADAIRLQHTELNEMLQGFAKALEKAERQIARAWFAWSFPTADAAQAAYEAAKVEITYPTEFLLDQLINDLQAWAEGLRMNLGKTMNARIRKSAAQRIDPNIPPDELDKIHAEIDAISDEPEPIPTDTGDPVGAGIQAAAHG